MYSGTTLTPLSGRLVGAHQKIDRLARNSIKEYLNDQSSFPSAKEILHFEGINGPDAIKRKSPAKDEPWHYYSPFSSENQELINIISDHYDKLVKALKENNKVRSAFEASWLAHAVVDGLTPAHHYPYEEKLEELRGGKLKEGRTSIKDKLIMPGTTAIEQIKNNWGMWGPKGLITTHGFFEWGVAAIILPMRTKKVALSTSDIDELYNNGIVELFKRKAKEIAALNIYESYQKLGWTPPLARKVKKYLVPSIIKTVSLIWYAALIDAGIVEKNS